MATNEEWLTWYERYGCQFGQFIPVEDAKTILDAAPESLHSVDLNGDALAVGRYMRRWQETGGELDCEAPHVPGDTFNDPAIEFSKIVGFIEA